MIRLRLAVCRPGGPEVLTCINGLGQTQHDHAGRAGRGAVFFRRATPSLRRQSMPVSSFAASDIME